MSEVHDLRGILSRRPLRILAISGSLRKASFSTAILKALNHEEFPNITIAVRTLEGIPLYNEDLDTKPALSAIAQIRAEVLESDGVVIASPEYNHGIPGVLKNGIDISPGVRVVLPWQTRADRDIRPGRYWRRAGPIPVA